MFHATRADTQFSSWFIVSEVVNYDKDMVITRLYMPARYILKPPPVAHFTNMVHIKSQYG